MSSMRSTSSVENKPQGLEDCKRELDRLEVEMRGVFDPYSLEIKKIEAAHALLDKSNILLFKWLGSTNKYEIIKSEITGLQVIFADIKHKRKDRLLAAQIKLKQLGSTFSDNHNDFLVEYVCAILVRVSGAISDAGRSLRKLQKKQVKDPIVPKRPWKVELESAYKEEKNEELVWTTHYDNEFKFGYEVNSTAITNSEKHQKVIDAYCKKTSIKKDRIFVDIRGSSIYWHIFRTATDRLYFEEKHKRFREKAEQSDRKAEAPTPAITLYRRVLSAHDEAYNEKVEWQAGFSDEIKVNYVTHEVLLTSAQEANSGIEALAEKSNIPPAHVFVVSVWNERCSDVGYKIYVFKAPEDKQCFEEFYKKNQQESIASYERYKSLNDGLGHKPVPLFSDYVNKSEGGCPLSFFTSVDFQPSIAGYYRKTKYDEYKKQQENNPDRTKAIFKIR